MAKVIGDRSSINPARQRQRSPTIRDVATKAGVSVGTVSRVLNSNATVADAIRHRVETSISELGYMPNRVAQSMRKRETMAVGCLITDMRATKAAEAVCGAESRLRAAGYDLFLGNSHDDPTQEDNILKFFRQRQLDAIITNLYDDQRPERFEFLKSLQVPIVLWERDGGEYFDSVRTDYYTASLQACSYLLELGHERIALIAAPLNVWTGREEVRGYETAMKRVGRDVDPALIAPAMSFDYAKCSELLRSENGVTAVIAQIDRIALVSKVAGALGRCLPADLSIVSIGDNEFLSMSSPAITAIRHDSERLGEIAAEFVLDRLNGTAPVKPRRVILPVELMVRQSRAQPNW